MGQGFGHRPERRKKSTRMEKGSKERREEKKESKNWLQRGSAHQSGRVGTVGKMGRKQARSAIGGSLYIRPLHRRAIEVKLPLQFTARCNRRVVPPSKRSATLVVINLFSDILVNFLRNLSIKSTISQKIKIGKLFFHRVHNLAHFILIWQLLKRGERGVGCCSLYSMSNYLSD